VDIDQLLRPTTCAICGTLGEATEMFPANLTSEAFDARHFSARRLPDRVHYRMVRCNRCGLVRSDPAGDPAEVARLYARSTFDYQDEVPHLRQTYGRYLARLDRLGADHDALLEIGSGNGFFLEEALLRGYRHVHGIEPSGAAISLAPDSVRQQILEDILRPGLLPEGSISVACLFQVFDHLPDPGAALDELHRLLRPGGMVLFLNHDIGALSAKMLGARSPIIDLEHYYLYSRSTLGRLAVAHGFQVVESGSVRNTYSVDYLARLLPLPSGVKRAVLGSLAAVPLGRLPLSVPLGNLYLVARRA
jgi:SAM-dependent methyltransferase